MLPQSHCWLNVLSGGVEELRFTTGDTPVGAEPAVAPRLPGVISAHAPCPLLTPAGTTAAAVVGWVGVAEGQWMQGLLLVCMHVSGCRSHITSMQRRS